MNETKRRRDEEERAVFGCCFSSLSQGCSANDNSRMAVGALHHTLLSLCLGDEGALNVISTID